MGKRTLDAGNQEVTFVTRWYSWDKDARLALCNFMRLAMEMKGGKVRMGKTGGPLPLLNTLNQEHERESEERKTRNRERRAAEGVRPVLDRTAKSTKSSSVTERRTTKEVLGTHLYCLPDKTTLARTSKSLVSRATVNGRDLVWKTVDFYGLPQHSDFTAEDLEDFMDTELFVYHKLSNLQGRVIPKFVFCGSDLNAMWAFVTTYEGEDLAKLAARDSLTCEDCDKAYSALTALHEAGVLHGDVALRNAVRRERDGAVLWIDFEQSQVSHDVDPAEFHALAQKELDELKMCFDDVVLTQQRVVVSECRPVVVAETPSAEAQLIASSSKSSLPNTTAAEGTHRVKRSCIVPCCGGT